MAKTSLHRCSAVISEEIYGRERDGHERQKWDKEREMGEMMREIVRRDRERERAC